MRTRHGRIGRIAAVALGLAVLGLAVPSAVASSSSASRTVLGSARFWPGDYDRGFGEVHPGLVSNGGDPSGIVRHITWQHWGSDVTIGWGKGSIAKPSGGYYAKRGRIKLKATRPGSCDGRRGYHRLFAREPKKPGGPLGPWFAWSGATNICKPYS